MNINKSNILFFCILIFMISCKKEDTTLPDFTANINLDPPLPTEASGLLVAAKTRSTTIQLGIPITVIIGKAIASFFSTPGDNSALEKAGVVKCENTNLLINSKNIYNNEIGLTNPTGISFGANVSWDVSGDSTNNIIAFHQTNYASFPTDFDIASPDVVNKTSDYIINTSVPITNSDGVVFIIASQNGETVTKYLAPNTSIYTFTSADMTKLGTGKGVVNISAWKGNIEDKSGKKYFFVQELVASKEIEIK